MNTQAYLFGYSTRMAFWSLCLKFCNVLSVGMLTKLFSKPIEKIIFNMIGCLKYPRMGLIDSLWLVWFIKRDK